MRRREGFIRCAPEAIVSSIVGPPNRSENENPFGAAWYRVVRAAPVTCRSRVTNPQEDIQLALRFCDRNLRLSTFCVYESPETLYGCILLSTRRRPHTLDGT